MFSKAIVRKPSSTYSQGLSSSSLGKPDYELCLKQHQAYIDAIKHCGVEVIELEAEEKFPDSTFVEDTAIVTEKCAIITHPGHISRRGEVKTIELELKKYRPIETIKAPGTLDGGDIMQVENHFYIGLSDRTNKEGADQLINFLNKYDYTASTIEVKDILHLKSGINYIGDDIIVLMESLKETKEIIEYKKLLISPEETYASNCIRINDYIIMAKGFPDTKKKLSETPYEIIELDMSEFEKMDGGLSCLSLRF